MLTLTESPSTERLQNQVSLALEQNPHLIGRKLRFESSDGRIILRGVVNSYFQKQMAQEALRGMDGVELIDNQLEVTWA